MLLCPGKNIYHLGPWALPRTQGVGKRMTARQNQGDVAKDSFIAEPRCNAHEMLQDFLFLHPQFAPSGCTLLTLLPARGGPVLLNRRCPPGRILTHSKATFLPCALGPNQRWAPSQLPPSFRTSTPTASVLMQISFLYRPREIENGQNLGLQMCSALWHCVLRN